tara:strand:+ start:10331 stop:12268 length:1938 start_codon:yes stop_codon:yes gene_type:complete
MCGIFGIVNKDDKKISSDLIKKIANKLFIFSETRGKEAAGIAINTGLSIETYKKPCSASEFIKEDKYKDLINFCLREGNKNFSLIGHSRLVTNGFAINNQNNQPVNVPGLVGIHNGIITNQEKILEANKGLKCDSEVDTEVFLRLIKFNLEKSKNNIISSVSESFNEIMGSASIATFFGNLPNLVLASNTGALFYIYNKRNTFFAFASERFILQKLMKIKEFKSSIGYLNVQQINSFSGLNIRLNSSKIEKKSFLFNCNSKNKEKYSDYEIKPNLSITDHSINSNNLKRCQKCILPETYPYIDLDDKGICRYCRQHKTIKTKGNQKLINDIKKYRSQDGKPDCIVALSGGRDSCYGLHYIKTVLGMNPIAFTYDWGFVTDLARRNSARICGKLGIEHIIRSANLSQKRRLVRKNVQAWLEKPELGMIPLFMAGDKAFFYHARELKKETGIKLVFFCGGNMIENASYKFGFSGIKDSDDHMTLTRLKIFNKLKLISYYFKNFLLNPRYFNESIFDTAAAYWHTFIAKEDFLWLYHYVDWNEDKIVKTIIDKYDWETSRDTTTTWRIGDGTASFYNYIYQTMAGFTEDDDMLSNMIRENYIDRDEALRRSKEYAKPRKESISEYLQSIGLNVEETLIRINSAKKLFK